MSVSPLQPRSFVLASECASRRAMLDALGLAYESIPADVDERAELAWCSGADQLLLKTREDLKLVDTRLGGQLRPTSLFHGRPGY